MSNKWLFKIAEARVRFKELPDEMRKSALLLAEKLCQSLINKPLPARSRTHDEFGISKTWRKLHHSFLLSQNIIDYFLLQARFFFFQMHLMILHRSVGSLTFWVDPKMLLFESKRSLNTIITHKLADETDIFCRRIHPCKVHLCIYQLIKAKERIFCLKIVHSSRVVLVAKSPDGILPMGLGLNFHRAELACAARSEHQNPSLK